MTKEKFVELASKKLVIRFIYKNDGRKVLFVYSLIPGYYSYLHVLWDRSGNPEGYALCVDKVPADRAHAHAIGMLARADLYPERNPPVLFAVFQEVEFTVLENKNVMEPRLTKELRLLVEALGAASAIHDTIQLSRESDATGALVDRLREFVNIAHKRAGSML